MSATLEVADTRPVFTVRDAEYRRLLGFPPDHELSERAAELSAWARDWYAGHGTPWFYARQAGRLALDEGAVVMDGAPFVAARLHQLLREAEADAAVIVAVSAGPEAEAMARRLWDDGKPDEYFFLEVYASAVVEALVSAAAYRLCAWADTQGIAVLPHYSPGYPGWPISDQQRLLDLAAAGSHGFPGGIRVLPSGMLQPKKALLAVYGLTRAVERVQRLTTLVPCTNCSLEGCRYRRAPYQHPLPQLEGVRSATVAAEPPSGNGAGDRPVLTPNARYSVAAGALEKWARDRLALTEHKDRSIEARFRYEGTTCSNMGRPLVFEYHLRLSPREEGYTITAASCAPAAGDTGYTYMCEYLANADGLMGALAAESPLLGRPLDDVLSWNRPRYPSGCYCTAAGREHKWGLALEVVHYALVRAGQRATP